MNVNEHKWKSIAGFNVLWIFLTYKYSFCLLKVSVKAFSGYGKRPIFVYSKPVILYLDFLWLQSSIHWRFTSRLSDQGNTADVQMVIKLISCENTTTAEPLLVIVHQQPVKSLWFSFHGAWFRHIWCGKSVDTSWQINCAAISNGLILCCLVSQAGGT